MLWDKQKPTEYEKYQQACREEVNQLRDQIRNYHEEVEKVQLNCEVCGCEIQQHYGEMTLSIQPHVIKDGSFWSIDKYMPDVLNRKVMCEPCIIKMKHEISYDSEDMYTWSQLWMFIKQKIRVWWISLRKESRS